MRCPSCGHQNPKSARYCNGCGVSLETPSRPRSENAYGIFYPWAGGWTTSSGLTETAKEAMELANSPATLSLSDPDKILRIGKVKRLPAEPGDDTNYILERLQVLSWRKLVWEKDHWAIGPDEPGPKTIIVSGLEKA